MKKNESESERLEKLKKFEYMAYSEGFQIIAGTDEVGRGPLAGPVAAAAVILPRDFYLEGVNDSKALSDKKRRELVDQIKQGAVSWAVALLSPQFIDRENILNASREAMRLAVQALRPTPDFLLVDAIKIPDLQIKQLPIIKGDSLSVSIACASIIAKVERDEAMQSYDLLYPQYGLGRHKGYATREHLLALQEFGPSPIHRRSFEPIKSMLRDSTGEQITLF
ncbi:MAG TPA: ribonuclease HII [Syntrophomonas sp.]|nr:ribonuclease HII [Syntrophomonas sp.]HPT69045.1 ribonuclease HII [Syntrophomonas sp.]